MPDVDLIDIVRERKLTVTCHEPGDIPATELVRQGEENRFQVELLDWDGSTVQGWRGHDPRELLEEALGRAALREAGSGLFKMRLFDRRGGYPRGETVTFTNSPPDSELARLLLEADADREREFEAMFAA